MKKTLGEEVSDGGDGDGAAGAALIVAVWHHGGRLPGTLRPSSRDGRGAAPTLSRVLLDAALLLKFWRRFETEEDAWSWPDAALRLLDGMDGDRFPELDERQRALPGLQKPSFGRDVASAPTTSLLAALHDHFSALFLAAGPTMEARLARLAVAPSLRPEDFEALQRARRRGGGGGLAAAGSLPAMPPPKLLADWAAAVARSGGAARRPREEEVLRAAVLLRFWGYECQEAFLRQLLATAAFSEPPSSELREAAESLFEQLHGELLTAGRLRGELNDAHARLQRERYACDGIQKELDASQARLRGDRGALPLPQHAEPPRLTQRDLAAALDALRGLDFGERPMLGAAPKNAVDFVVSPEGEWHPNTQAGQKGTWRSRPQRTPPAWLQGHARHVASRRDEEAAQLNSHGHPPQPRARSRSSVPSLGEMRYDL